MSIQVRRIHSGLPCAMALRLIRALPGDPALLSPSSAGLTANLTPTLGRQDHTLSPYASCRTSIDTNASTAARPNVSDVGRHPLFSGQDGPIEPVICIEKQAPLRIIGMTYAPG